MDNQKRMPKPPDQQSVDKTSQMPDAADDRGYPHSTRETGGEREGVNPRNVDSMPRAENDKEVLENSPEFRDQPKGE
jgi:hypothetical protein